MFHGLGWRKPKQERRKVTRSSALLRAKRVGAELQIQGSKEIVQGRVFLHDLSPSGVGIFANEPVQRGQRVSVVIEYPRQLFIKGEVMWCSLWMLNPKVISVEPFRYRLGIRLIYDTPFDREAVEQYCNEISEVSS